MSRRTYDVAIVGGGIVGAACAYECATRDLAVLMIERGITGGGATAAGMGHIVVMDDSQAQFILTRYSQQLWQTLRSELPADAEYEQCGTIWVACDEDEMREVERKQRYYSSHGVPVQVVNGRDLESCEKNLRKGLAGGLLVPEDAVLYPPCAARFLIDRAKMKGADVIANTAVLGIGKGLVVTTGETFSAGAIINASGADAAELTPGIGIRKRKGHLAITDRYPGFLRHQLIELGYLKSAGSASSDSVAFNVQPRKTTQVLIGSSRQFTGEDRNVDSEILSRMLRRAQEYMPNLAGVSVIRVWTGFRAATADKLPLIGRWPEDDTVYLATGHEGLGITNSLATGRLVVDTILGTAPEIPVDPYLPERLLPEKIHA